MNLQVLFGLRKFIPKHSFGKEGMGSSQVIGLRASVAKGSREPFRVEVAKNLRTKSKGRREQNSR